MRRRYDWKKLTSKRTVRLGGAKIAGVNVSPTGDVASDGLLTSADPFVGLVLSLSRARGGVAVFFAAPALVYFGFMVIYVPAIILVAHLMFHLVEEPARRRLRNTWAERRAPLHLLR